MAKASTNAASRSAVSAWLDVVAPVMTIDSPSARMMKSWKRSAKCETVICHAEGAIAGRPGSGKSRTGAR